MTAVAVGVFEDKVVITWEEVCKEITFDPQNAYQIGTAMARAALEAHRGTAEIGDHKFIEGEVLGETKKKVSDLERMGMVMQVSTIIRTLMDQKRAAGYIAAHCVDAVLRETAR